MSVRNQSSRAVNDPTRVLETDFDIEGQPIGPTRRRLWRPNSNRVPWISIAIVLFVLVLPALFAELITTHDPLRGVLADRLTPPFWMEGGSWTYPLGTDKQGRDILTRLIYGARISLTVSGITILIGAVIGSTLGLLAGYFGGWIDRFVSWLIDTFLSLPHVLLALVIVAAIGPSFVTIVAIIAVTIWASFARQVRGETLS
ncbi:MAG: ABC transporter permease, partial [Acidimicrobiia bacterium]